MNLEELRIYIDEIDERIFDLLKQRLNYVGQVGKLKKLGDGKKYIIRPGREAQKVKKAYEMAKEAGYSDKISMAVASIWREIISLSINFEEEAKIGFNEKKSKETAWMLREYFGPYSKSISYDLDKNVVKALLDGSVNIAALTYERKTGFEPWWISLGDNPELSIFATMPLFPLDKKLDHSVLLVSKVTPEPSGSDKFIYYVKGALPEDEKDTFEIISEYKDNYLVTSDEFYNNYQSKLNAKYLGCVAVLEF